MTPNRRLKQARELRGWSQAKVAEQIGTDATTVSRWERGLFSPTPYFRERLCTLFSQNAEELGLLESCDRSADGERRALSARPPATLAFQREHEGLHSIGPQITTIAPPAAPSWPRRGDTFEYILDSAAHDQQAHTLWEDAYVRIMRGQRAEAQQLGEASLNAFEHVGHPNAEAIREWLRKNELTPSSPPPANIPSAPLPLLPKEPKRTIKQMFRRRNVGLAFVFLAIAALCLTSFSLNHASVPSVQAGVQNSPTARAHGSLQPAFQATTIVTATSPATKPTSPPTSPPSNPAANTPDLSISVSPAKLTPASCMPDSGYRCTLYVTVYSSEAGDLHWQAISKNMPVQFNPSSGTGTSGQTFEVIAYVHSSPGQSSQLTFTLKFSSHTIQTSVTWQD